jgi:hypothetical protein
MGINRPGAFLLSAGACLAALALLLLPLLLAMGTAACTAPSLLLLASCKILGEVQGVLLNKEGGLPFE